MKIVKMKSAYEISAFVSDIIANQILTKPNSVLGFATGASPVETYKRLIEKYESGIISFKDVLTFNLDEYCGLSKDNENSYFYFMKENLFGKTDVDFSNVHFLSGQSGNIEEECELYRKMIDEAGGIDIQLLGVGTNGHIGFNEPSDKFADGPFMVKLTQSTIDANSKYFENGDMPEYALTMGIGDIMKAKKILLIATGKSKANAVYSMAKGEITPKCPASVLRMHPDATIFVDEESAALI
ncbi:MAG: glucosamine-6-phosphate deaminase [Acutalibacteraceae bacterium]